VSEPPAAGAQVLPWLPHDHIGSVISNIAEQLASNQTCFFKREGGAKAWVAMESTQLIIAELKTKHISTFFSSSGMQARTG
jgi:hypothetical protein